jgi:hypothetical protein
MAQAVPFPLSHNGRLAMMQMLHFATLVITTLFAAAAAVALNWLFLRTMFVLMKPATARQRAVKAQPARALAHGTTQLVRAYASHR